LPMAVIGGTVFAMGVCFFWPTMLGTVSERFPKTGALGLAIMGGAGMLATFFAQPVIGGKYDAVTKQTEVANQTITQAQADNTWMYRAIDFKDGKAFGKKVSDGTDGVSKFLRDKLPAADVDAAKSGEAGADKKLAEDMNGILVSGPIYDKNRFTAITAPADLQTEAVSMTGGPKLPQVNRSLLDLAYPTEVTPSTDTARFSEPSLAMGGRAAIQQVVVLPIVLVVIFTGIFFYDKSRGGYRKEVLVQEQADRK